MNIVSVKLLGSFGQIGNEWLFKSNKSAIKKVKYVKKFLEEKGFHVIHCRGLYLNGFVYTLRKESKSGGLFIRNLYCYSTQLHE